MKKRKAIRGEKLGIKTCMCFVLVLFLISGCTEQRSGPEPAVEDSSDDQAAPEPSATPESIVDTTGPLLPAADVTITVIYDNKPYNPNLTTDWGFSCLIEGCEKTILFDTGGNGGILSKNMQELGINPEEIDIIILSHIHGDHVDGLPSVLAKTSDVTVYVLRSFPSHFKENVKNLGADVVEVSEPVKICEHVYSSGRMSGIADEQALIITTDRGLLIITGCAHPGIVGMVNRAKILFQDDILLAMGGFHLTDATRPMVDRIISDFRALGVLYAGPCHCTGSRAMDLFSQEYGDYYVDIGVGTVIYVKDLG